MEGDHERAVRLLRLRAPARHASLGQIMERQHMVEGIPLGGPADLDRLAAFLRSAKAPDNSMGVSDLDGFLTGLIVGPEPIMPSDWLPVIWGHEEPKFANMDEAQAIIGMIMGRYNEIVHHLAADPPVLQPVFMQAPDGQVIIADWAAGFLDAAKLRPKAWAPLVRDKDTGVLLTPFFALGGAPEDRALFGLRPEAATREEMRQLVAKGPDFLVDCVFAIRMCWQDCRRSRERTRGCS
jgi:uncharacterized protein